jgi:tetratricopeptide (TPR) repeat protein
VDVALSALQRRDFSVANQMLDRALLLSPQDAGILGIKGMAAYEAGHYEAAETMIRRALLLNPDDSRLYNFLGQVQLALKEKIAAERSFGRAVTLTPDFFEAWYNLGVVQLQMLNAAEAAHSFERVLRQGGQDGELQMQLANAYYLQGEKHKAEKALRQALRLEVDPVRGQLWLSAVLYAQGKTEEAERLESLTRDMPGSEASRFDVVLALGQVETHLGHLDEAKRWLQQAVALRPADVRPYLDLAAIHKFVEQDRPLIEKMAALSVTCAPEYLRGLEFALGKIYTDIAEYDVSFGHYQAGNDWVRQTIPFDCLAFTDMVSREIEPSTGLLTQSVAPGSTSNLPILIVGTPRSGTTLTEQIVSSHSQVAGAGEMDFWPRLAPSLLSTYTEERAKQVANGYLDLLRQEAPNAKRITDKLPGNFLHLGIIHAAMPNAKIIHCKRHPIDACMSIYFQNFNDAHAYKWDLDSLAVWYEQYQRLMAHWRSVLPADTLFEFRYEDLVEDLEGVSKQIMTFQNLEWEPAQLDFYKQDRAVFTASKWQARQPIYKTSKERWRRYEKHLGPLLPLLKYAD